MPTEWALSKAREWLTEQGLVDDESDRECVSLAALIDSVRAGGGLGAGLQGDGLTAAEASVLRAEVEALRIDIAARPARAEVERLREDRAKAEAGHVREFRRANDAYAEVERLRKRVEWFEKGGGIDKTTAFFKEQIRADQAEADVARLRAEVADAKRTEADAIGRCVAAQTDLEKVVKVSERKDDVILGLEGLLAAYRLGSHSRADAALTKLEKARVALAAAKGEPTS